MMCSRFPVIQCNTPELFHVNIIIVETWAETWASYCSPACFGLLRFQREKGKQKEQKMRPCFSPKHDRQGTKTSPQTPPSSWRRILPWVFPSRSPVVPASFHAAQPWAQHSGGRTQLEPRVVSKAHDGRTQSNEGKSMNVLGVTEQKTNSG